MSSTSSVASAPSVRFAPNVSVQQQPSANLMAREDADSYSDDDNNNSNGAQKKSSGRAKKSKRKISQEDTESSALGNNSTPTENKRKTGKQPKPKHTDPQPEKNMIRKGSGSRSRSPAEGGKQQQRVPNELTQKQSRMRTIEDCLNRIKHDPLILTTPSYLKHFVIAYIDRVFGDQEIAFEEFFVNEDTKDVPLHRISYLRYCDEIVYNRSLKYDAIFGSSNANGVTLEDWLARTDELVHQQNERWAYMVAAEKVQEAEDALLLKRLSQSISEQKEEIAARQGADLDDARSTATSGFDFGEESEGELDEDEEQIEDEQGDASAQATEDVTPAASPIISPAIHSVAASNAAPTAAASVLDSLESLPSRTRVSRHAKPTHSVPAAATAPTEVSPTPQNSAPASSSVSMTESPRASREDDSNLTLHISYFSPSHSRLTHSGVVRVSEHFDWTFLRKRIASRLNVDGGAKEVRRLYLKKPNGESIKLTEENFRSILTDQAQIILMGELDVKSANPALILQAPKKDSEGERRKDEELVKHAVRMQEASTTAANQSLSSSAALASAVQASKTPAPVVAAKHDHVGNQHKPSHVPSSAARKSGGGGGSNGGRPNYFVSLRITNPAMLERLYSVQADLVKYDPRLSDACVPRGTLHLTLSLVCANREEDVRTAERVMREQAEKVRDILSPASGSPTTIPVSCLSSFGGKVLFADIPASEGRIRLNQVATLLGKAFREAGVGHPERERGEDNQQTQGGSGARHPKGAAVFTPSTAGAPPSSEPADSFTPHLTLAKLSRVTWRGPSKSHSSSGRKPPKGWRKPQVQKQNTGIIELADERDLAGDAQGEELDQLPQTDNQFEALLTTSAPMASLEPFSAATEFATASDLVDAGSASLPTESPILNPSTSVLRRIDPRSYASWSSFDFGVEQVVSIDLCAMMGPKQPDGYYAVREKIEVRKTG